MNGHQITDTAFFKSLVQMNDKEKIATAIASDILNQVESGFKVMEHFGFTGEDVTAVNIYLVAEQIIKLKK